MFQSFQETSDPSQGPARLARLRAQMQAEGLAGFLIPRADAEATRFDGASWLHYRLPESGTPVLARGVAVIAGVEHRARAEALVDHLGSLDVRTMAKLETRWQPAYGDVDEIRVPLGFELEQSWRPYELAADHIERERAGWLDRWERHVRGR